MVLAQEEANGFKHDHIGTEHILLGLVREREGTAARVLRSFDITVERVRGEVVRTVGVGQTAAAGQLPYTTPARKALELAQEQARGLGQNYIGTEHILLGLVAVNDDPATRIMSDFNVSPDAIRSEVIRTVSGAGPPLGAPAEPGQPVEPGREQAQAGFDEWIRVGPGAGARRLLVRAAGRALDDGRSEIEARDVLLALTRDEKIAPVLADLGVDEAAVLDALSRSRGPQAPPDVSDDGH
ncbi:MAG TPA: Clp protease N-terminal domain-containing protein [Solirubrobacteraceae bacterium]|nr:Clp protease N-terminal domain-containing protein [Solirubrobacteraceae bacterium]